MKCTPCKGTGTLAGAREAFMPRSGRVYAQCDYPQLELYTLAQCCVTRFGESKLAEALNAGKDPHLEVASLIVGCSYDEAQKRYKAKDKRIKSARDAAKVANFGFPGGLGLDSLIEYARKGSNVILTREPAPGGPLSAQELKEFWLQAWPEMQRYFARIRRLCNNASKRATVETLSTKRIRGNATYCAAANNDFQALGSDCAKEAAWRITKAEYVGTPSEHALSLGLDISPLFNARTVAFVHDEFIAEVDDNEFAHDAAYELAHLMREGANKYLPDVPVPEAKMVPLLMRQWSKAAESVWDANGRLVPWAA